MLAASGGGFAGREELALVGSRKENVTAEFSSGSASGPRVTYARRCEGGAEDMSMLWHSGRRLGLGIAFAALVGACDKAPSAPNREAASVDAPEVKAALDGIRAGEIEKHMRF